MLKVKSGEVAQVLDFVAVDSTDKFTRETGISAWTVYRSRGGGTATVFTTPTVTEKSAGNMPGVYHLLMDEDMTITSGKLSEVMTFHITATGVAPITVSIMLVDFTNTATGAAASVTGAVGSVTGAVGSVTGNVGGNVTGSVGSVASGGITAASLASATITAAKFGVGAIDASAIADGAIDAATFAAGAINAAAIAADAIGASELAADAVTEIAAAVAAGSVASVVGAVGSVTGNVGGNVVGSIGSVASGGITATSIAADAIGASELAADAATEIAAAVWDKATSSHVTSGTFGERLYGVRSSTAQAGAAGTITLDAGASAVDDFYNNALIVLVAGVGAGQARFVSDYVGATKVATVNGNWITNPDVTSRFVIAPFGSLPGASAPSAADVADAVWDEVRADHTTVGTFGEAGSAPTASVVADAVWDEARGGHAIAGSYGESVVVAAAGLATDAVNEIADGLLDKTSGVETGLTVRQALRLEVAALAGKLSGGGTNSIVIRNIGDTLDRITASVSQDGDRTVVTRNLG